MHLHIGHHHANLHMHEASLAFLHFFENRIIWILLLALLCLLLLASETGPRFSTAVPSAEPVVEEAPIGDFVPPTHGAV